MGANSRLNIRVGADLTGFSSGMQNLSRKLQQTGRKMKAFGSTMTQSFSMPLALLGGASVKVFADFEDKMAAVQAVSGATTQEFKSLEQNALELGRATRFTATEVAQLQLNYSKLGFSAAEITQVTQATLNLALATGSDLARSSEIAGATLRGMGLDVSELQRVTDVMGSAFSNSALDMEKWGNSMSYAAPLAESAGIPIENVAAMLSVLADAGIHGSKAGTALRRIFTEVAKEGGNWEEAFNKIMESGIKVEGAIDEVGQRAMSSLLKLNSNKEGMAELAETYRNSEGSIAEMAATMDNTTKGQMLRLKSAVEGMLIAFGELIAKAISPLVEWVTGLAQRFAELDSTSKKMIIVAGGLTAVIGPLALALGGLMMMINPIGLAVAGLAVAFGLLVGGVALFREQESQAVEQLKAERSEIQGLVGEIDLMNEGEEDRIKLIDELKEKYPDFIKDIDSEKVSNLQLTNALHAINQEYMKKIVLQKQSDFVEKQRQKTVDRANKTGDAELALWKAIDNATQKYGLTTNKNTSLVEQATLLHKELASQITFVDIGRGNAIRNLKGGIIEFSKATNNQVINETKLFNAQDELNRLMEEYGPILENIIDLNDELDDDGGGGGDDGDDGGKPDPKKEITDLIALKREEIKVRQDLAATNNDEIAIKNRDLQLLRQQLKDLEDLGIVKEEDAEKSKDLIKLKQNELAILGETEARTESEIEARNKKAEAIQAEITRLQQLGIETQSLDDITSDALDAMTEKWNGFFNIFTEVLDGISGIFQQAFTNKEIALDNYYEREKAYIIANSKTEEEQTKALDALDAEIAQKEAKRKKKMAKFDKAYNIFSTIIETARAVASSLPNIPLSIAVGAAGAIQTALIAAQPIPEFAQGGLVYGPTMGLMGEYRGASTNPEVIAPLSKLEEVLGNNMVLTTKVAGSDLQLIIERASSNRLNQLGY